MATRCGRFLCSVLLFSSLLAVTSSALRLPVERRAVRRSSKLQKRQSVSTGTQEVVTNFLSNAYFVNITVGGVELTVLIDTGSTDFFVTPETAEEIPAQNSTGLEASVTFALGQVVGTIGYAPVSFGSYSVASQAFLNITTVTDIPLDDLGARGQMGLALSTANSTAIDATFSNLSMPLVEANVIANIIAQNPSLSNYFTVHLGRTNDTGADANGVLTVGELVQGFEAVDNAPKVPQPPAPAGTIAGRWTVAVDSVLINGQSLQLQSLFNSTPAGQALAVLDTGFSRPPLPPALAQAIYDQIPGSVLASDGSGNWFVPCTAIPPNVTVVIGGSPYYIHPLDITSVATITPDLQESSNGTFCAGTFTSGNSTQLQGFGVDMILGQPFLRNVYAKFNFGNQIIGAPPTIPQEATSVQLLATTDLNTAFEDFVASRNAELAASLPEISPSDAEAQQIS